VLKEGTGGSQDGGGTLPDVEGTLKKLFGD